MATASLFVEFAADDPRTVLFNGMPISNNLAQLDMFESFQPVTAFSAMSGFGPGLNELSSVVVNGRTVGPTALLVTNIRVTASAVPAPIAGVGFPVVLGLAGAWFVRRRKRALAA